VLLGASGNTVLAGEFQGALNFFGMASTLQATSSGSVFLGIVDATGNGVKSWTVPAPLPQATLTTGYLASAVDASGNILLAATYSATYAGAAGDAGDAGPPVGLALGGTCGTLPFGTGSFVAMFDSSLSCKVSAAFPAMPARAAIAAVPTGFVLAGGINGVADFGCASVPTTVGEDVFVAGFDATGKCSSLTVYVNLGDEEATGLAADSAGHLFLSGTFTGGMLDLGTSAPLLGMAGQKEAFVAALGIASPWATRFQGSSLDSVGGLALLPAAGAGTPQDVVVAGSFDGALDVNDGGLATTQPAIFAARLSGANGATVWAHTIAGTGPVSVAADGKGNTAYAGASGSDVLVAELDPSGDAGPSTTISGTAKRQSNGIVFDANGGRLVAGTFGGTLDGLDGGSLLMSAGGNDIFLLRLCP
jgi:hypothetical protein